MTQELDRWATQAYTEYKDEMEYSLNELRKAIDNNEMPKAKELLQQVDKKTEKRPPNSIKRPSNSNIIYTNQLGKFGLLDIIRKFCEKHGINKQKLVPISKKVSNILWKELTSVHKKYFEELAVEVKKEHKIMYPDYKYQPKRKPNNFTKFKEYAPNESKSTTIDSISCIPSPMNTIVSTVTSQEYHEDGEYGEQIEDFNLTDDEIQDTDESSYPKFYEEPPPPPLEVPTPIEENDEGLPSSPDTTNEDDVF